MGTKLASLFLLGLMLAGVGPAQASTSGVSTAIESFVAKLFPQARHYFWIVNDTKSDTQREMIVDINTIVTNKVGAPPHSKPILAFTGEWPGVGRTEYSTRRECGLWRRRSVKRSPFITSPENNKSPVPTDLGTGLL